MRVQGGGGWESRLLRNPTFHRQRRPRLINRPRHDHRLATLPPIEPNWAGILADKVASAPPHFLVPTPRPLSGVKESTRLACSPAPDHDRQRDESQLGPPLARSGKAMSGRARGRGRRRGARGAGSGSRARGGRQTIVSNGGGQARAQLQWRLGKPPMAKPSLPWATTPTRLRAEWGAEGSAWLEGVGRAGLNFGT